jgi:hypothetical protein
VKWPGGLESVMNACASSSTVRVQFLPVGRDRREWMWKARDESNTISISGQRFDSLTEAMRDAREQVFGDADEGPLAA